MIKAIQDYIRLYNKNPRPFQRVASAGRIIRKVKKYKELQKHETNLAPRFRETMLVNIGTAFLMPTSRIKPARKVANKPPAKNAEATVRLAKPQGHSIRKKAGQDAVKASSTAKNKAVAKKPTRARRRAGPSQKAAGGIYQLDLSAFFPESVTQREKWICLACVLDVFTRHMGLNRVSQPQWPFSRERSYANASSRRSFSRIRRRVRSTKASLLARQLSSRTPRA